MVLLWAVILPGILIKKLVKHKNRLHDYDVRRLYSFFYQGFKPEFFYWEFVIFARKIALLLTVILAGLNSRKL